MEKPYISELVLNNFRNYSYKIFNFANDYNAIVGNNGMGKTNILEAISIFGDSKGLRNADTKDLINIQNQETNDILFSLFIKIQNSDYEKILITCKKEEGSYKKNITVDGEQVKKQSILNEIFKINYITPQMDTFFLDSSSLRRKFLDKTASLLYVDHYEIVKKYEFFVKERMKILANETKNDLWLDIVEKKITELGVSIASIRNQVVENLNNIFESYNLSFPVGIIEIKGDIENMLLTNKASDVEKYYLNKLKENRIDDFKSKKTNFGLHKSDLIMIHKSKQMPANLCSTGEQKLLLISLVIIRCIFSKNINKGIPILLLDEVCSHLDKNVKELLFKELEKLNIQIFLTGLEEGDFNNLTQNIIKL